MKKKFLLVGVTAAVATISAVSLGSCTSGSEKSGSGAEEGYTAHHYVEAPDAPTYATDGGTLDICLNYSGTGGIVRVAGQGTAYDPLDPQIVYTEGSMLPVWTAFASYTKTTLRDASNYGQTNDNNTWSTVDTAKFKNLNDSSQDMDLLYNSTSNFRSNVSSLTDLTPYIEDGTMPNFKTWLDNNPTMKKAISVNGKIYYTPYFDGYNDIERMFIMDTAMTKKVLNSKSGWDTTTNGGSNPALNVVQGAFYQPFINADYNYAADTTVDVCVGGVKKTITIKKTENIIKQQNAKLASGCTGADLAQQFVTYIKAAYKDAFDKGYYTDPADLFVSEAAAYNCDELIALLRVVKANPGMLTGDSNAEIETFFPRAMSNNRCDNMMDIAQIWGVQGLDAEQNNFYFGGDGKIHALETTQATYDTLTYLSQMYDEGLILGEFWTNGSKADKTGFLDKYYKKTVEGAGYGFMMYDYSAANCAANDIYGGIGTNPASRTIKDADGNGLSVQGITSVLPPLTYWGTESNWTNSQKVNDFTGKTLTRYYESNRALKGNTWAIPANSDNKAGAARMMDFMFSEFGLLMQDYGPKEYWNRPSTSKGDTIDGNKFDSSKYYVSDDLVIGEKNAIISTAVKSGLAASGTDFWTYCRNVLGTTHGIGHVRSKGINLQATNYYAQQGYGYLQNAISTGVVNLAKVDKYSTFTWDTSVPTGYVSTYKDSTYKYGALTGFWASDKAGNPTGWVSAVVNLNKGGEISVIDAQKATTTYTKVQSEFTAFNQNALYTYAYSVGADYVPAYANSNA